MASGLTRTDAKSEERVTSIVHFEEPVSHGSRPAVCVWGGRFLKGRPFAFFWNDSKTLKKGLWFPGYGFAWAGVAGGAGIDHQLGTLGSTQEAEALTF